MKEKGANLDIVDFVKYTPLHICAQKNNLKMAELLLELGADPSASAVDGNEPLHLYVQDAVETSDAKMIKTLVKYGADVNKPGANGDAPVHIASRWNKPSSFRVLLEMGADIKIKDRQGRDAFDIATEYKHQDILSIIKSISGEEVIVMVLDETVPCEISADQTSYLKPLEKSIINRKDSKGNTLLATAIGKKAFNTVKFLLENGADPNLYIGDGSSPLHIASAFNDKAIIKLLLDYGVCIDSLNGEGITPLQVAFKRKNIEAVKFLIATGANLDFTDYEGYAPVHLASFVNSSEIINLLAKAGCDVDRKTIDGRVPLFIALENGATESAIALIDLGADIKISSNDGMSVLLKLCVARLDGKERVLKKLIDKGADLNETDKLGNTLLHLASRCNEDFIQILLDKGADVNVRKCRFETSLYSFISGNFNSALLLISRGAIIDDIDGNENSALHILCWHSNNPDSFSRILNGPININRQNLEGDTVLHKAVFNKKCFEIIKMLLNAGANPNIKNLMGQTPLHLAGDAKEEVLELLVDAGADPNFRDNSGITILMSIARTHQADSKIKVLEKLIEKGADVDMIDYNGHSAVSILESVHHSALQREALELFKRYSGKPAGDLSLKRDDQGNHGVHRAVLRNDAAWFDSFCKSSDLDLRNRNHMTPLHLAVLNNKIECLVKLIEMKADVNAKTEKGITPLHLAVSEDNREVIRILLDNGAEIDSKDYIGETPIFKAVQKNSIELVRLLFNSGASVNVRSKNGELFHEASKYMDNISFFLDLNFNINEKDSAGNTPLCLAKKYGKSHNVHLLLNKGAEPIEDNETLTRASLFYSQGGFQYEIKPEFRVDPNYSDERGVTLLHRASKKGDSDYIAELIKNGAVVDKKDIQGRTPLHYASIYSDTNAYKNSQKNPHYNIYACRTLISCGADINARDKYGATPLHLSIDCPDEKLMGFLIENGADIDAVDNYGETALIKSMRSLKEEKALFLLNRKADHSIVNCNGETALDIVIANKGALQRYSTLYLLMDGAKKKAERLRVYDYNNISLAEVLIEEKDFYLLDRLLEIDNDILMQNDKGRTLIHYAVMNDNPDLIKYFADKGVYLNAVDNSGYTALSMAVMKNKFEMVAKLLESGADINYAVEGKTPPIIYAFNLPDLRILRYLIDKGADPCTENPGKPVLMYAVEKFSVDEIREYFSGKDIDFNIKDTQGANALFYAKDCEKIEFLIENNADINCSNNNGETPLLKHCRNCAVDAVKLLLERGADANRRSNNGKSSLHYGISSGNHDLVKLLIEKGARIDSADSHGYQAIHIASLRNQALNVKYLLERGAMIDTKNYNGETPLIVAVKNKALDAVKLLIDEGANTSIKDNNGKSADELMNEPDYLASKQAVLDKLKKTDEKGMTQLLWMANEGNLSEVKRLIDMGADVNWTDFDGSNALHWAVVSNSGAEIIDYLISCKCSVAKEDVAGQTPLHVGAQVGNADACEILVKQNADINKKNSFGLTPLHWASSLGEERIVEILLKNGAKIDICNNMGKTPLDLAKDAREENKKTAIDLTKDSIYYSIIRMLEDTDKFKQNVNVSITQSESKIQNSGITSSRKKSIWQKIFKRSK